MDSQSLPLSLAAGLLAAGCGGSAAEPLHFCFRPAAELRLPGYTDSNSPADWSGGTLRIFHGSNTDTFTDVKSLQGLETAPSLEAFTLSNRPDATWLEATYRRPAPDQARLYGFYHSEWGRAGTPRCGAAGFDPTANLGVAKIGVMYSDDEGLSWTNLGIVLEPPDSDRNCDAGNGDFASGNGDPDVVQREGALYFYYGNYGGPASTQGISVARLLLADLDAPVGKVLKWDGKAFTVPGLGGASVPLASEFVARVPYDGKVDSLWGPSIHYNGVLKTYVMVLNRTRYDGPFYGQEGAYVSFNPSVTDPRGWSPPVKFSWSGGSAFYPEFISLKTGETDKRITGSARYFESGVSRYSVDFVQGPALPADCLAVIP